MLSEIRKSGSLTAIDSYRRYIDKIQNPFVKAQAIQTLEAEASRWGKQIDSLIQFKKDAGGSHDFFNDKKLLETEKLQQEIQNLRFQLKQEKKDTAAVFWLIFFLGFGYGFYADPTIYRFTHNVGDLMGPLVGLAAVASTLRSQGVHFGRAVVAGIVFDEIVYAALYFLFR